MLRFEHAGAVIFSLLSAVVVLVQKQKTYSIPAAGAHKHRTQPYIIPGNTVDIVDEMIALIKSNI